MTSVRCRESGIGAVKLSGSSSFRDQRDKSPQFRPKNSPGRQSSWERNMYRFSLQTGGEPEKKRSGPMKPLWLGMMGALLIGCSASTPMTPSIPGTTALTIANADSRTQRKISLYFYTYTGDRTAHHNLPGLPVTIVFEDLTELHVTPDQTGNVSFWLPIDDDGFTVQTAAWGGYCAIERYMTVPLSGPRGGWIGLPSCPSE
jgi:hypothetical protein